MKRTIFFTGELQEKFGEKIVLDSDNLQDVVKGITANKPEFRKYLVDLIDRGLDIRVYNAGKYLGKKEAPLFPLEEGDVILSVAPEGELKKLFKAILGIAMIVLAPFTGGASLLVSSIGATLVTQGIAEYLAPEPYRTEEAQDSYLFAGPKNRFLSGQILPVVYGEMRVGGFPMNIQIVSAPFDAIDSTMDIEGNIYAGRE